MKFALVLLCALSLAGCKIVYDSDVDGSVIPEGPDGDDARNAARLDDTFATELLPLVTAKALPLAQLRTLLADGVDTAGAAYANRGAGQGAAWHFAITDTGKIVEANLTSSARTAEVDVDGDGAGDLRLQLGPVIRGTALRDVAPFYNFDDFRDQIEFAKLARAINDRIKTTLEVPEGDLLGQTVTFTGVVPVKRADDRLVVTLTELAVQP